MIHEDAIEVDAHAQLRSGDHGGGDVALAHNAAAGRGKSAVEHWGDALEHGKVAGRRAGGLRRANGRVPGFWSHDPAPALSSTRHGETGMTSCASSSMATVRYCLVRPRWRGGGLCSHTTWRPRLMSTGRELIAAGKPLP